MDSIAYYQVDCIGKHPEIPILPIRVAVSDQRPCLEIDIPDRIALKEYLAGHPFSREEWIDLLIRAGEVVHQGMDHFLDPFCFELSLSTIFVSYKQGRFAMGDIRFLYVPIVPHSENDPIGGLCGEILRFLSTALLESPENPFSHEERETIAEWSVNSLEDGLGSLRSMRTGQNKPVRTDRLKSHEVHLASKSTIPGFIYLYGGLGVELILIYAAFQILQHQTRFAGRLVPILIVSVILLGFAALDLYLLYSKKSPLYLEEERENGLGASPDESDFVSAFRVKEEKTVLLEQVFPPKRIAMICSGIPGTPEENIGRKAYILVDDFLIGREGSKVDFKIGSLSVGRIHARIVRNENSFFIEDLDSRNGTFVDQRRLKKGEEYLLPENCKIRFADKEFFFVAN